jgi:hypothetical protein
VKAGPHPGMVVMTAVGVNEAVGENVIIGVFVGVL